MKKSIMNLFTNVADLIKTNIDTIEYKPNLIVLNNVLPISVTESEIAEFKAAEDKVLWLLLTLGKNTEIKPEAITWWYHNKYSKSK